MSELAKRLVERVQQDAAASRLPRIPGFRRVFLHPSDFLEPAGETYFLIDRGAVSYKMRDEDGFIHERGQPPR
jgi:hypothetical protein